MTDTFVDTPAEPTSDRKQLVAAILLGIAATLTALSAYQAALLDGEALQGYNRSTRTLSDANAFFSQGNQTVALDNQLFVQYAAALQAGNQELADYVRTLMRPELSDAIDWWSSTNEAVTPFDESDDNPYLVQDFVDANELEAEADAQFEEGADADDKGDLFELAAVLLALTLFFGGIATLFKRPVVATGLLVVGCATLAAGVAQFIAATAA